MNYITKPAKEFRALLPSGYKKRKVTISPAESVQLRDLNWSGGTRSEYVLVRLVDGARIEARMLNEPAPWENAAEGKTVKTQPGIAIVRHGYFCGQPSVATIYVHPADMPKVLA